MTAGEGRVESRGVSSKHNCGPRRVSGWYVGMWMFLFRDDPARQGPPGEFRAGGGAHATPQKEINAPPSDS
jgi:hypothetical protein